MNAAIIYTRVSSEEQIAGTSLDFQEKQCREYCKQKGIEVLEVFREEGASAKTATRAEFLRAVEHCRKNKADYFIVSKVDRFSRSTENHFAIRKILLDYGTQLLSVTEPIGGNNPMEKLFETMLAGFSDFDNAIRRQRSMDGMSEKVNQGIYPWKAPLGYGCAHTKKQGLKKMLPDPPDESIFPIIQRGLKEFAKGNCTKTELAKLLDTWGLADKRNGKKTYVQLVDQILSPRRLKFYAGVLENPWTGLDVVAQHTPMIDEGTRNQILYKLSGKKPRRVSIHNENFPLRGTIFCDECKTRLTGSTSRGNGGLYFYYHCKKKGCDKYGKAIRKKDLEESFSKYLNKITPTEKFLKVFKETVIDYWDEQGRTFNEAANSYEKQLAALESRRKRIFDMREAGEYSQEEFTERKQQVDAKIVTMKISISEARIEQFDVEAAVSYATQFISDLHRQWNDLPVATLPRFQKLVFPDGITPKQLAGVQTVRLGCIFELCGTAIIADPIVVPPLGIEPRSKG